MGTFWPMFWHNNVVAPIKRFLRDQFNKGELAYFPFTDRCEKCKKEDAILTLVGQDHYKCRFCSWHYPASCHCEGELSPRHGEFRAQIKDERARRRRGRF